MQASGQQGDESENSGLNADPVESKSASKQPSGAAGNTDSNPDKV